MSSGKPRAVGFMQVFAACRIDVGNKQLFSPVSWNNPLLETLVGESYILTNCRHLDAQEEHSLDVERIYNM